MNSGSLPGDALTERELDILRLVALGLSNREIAEELVLAPETVRWYTKQIYSKLGVRGRIEAINRARELRLLEPLAQAAAVVVDAPSAAAHNLPAPITPFIGRRAERAEVSRLLHAVRLLTLTGVGGTGKTRLALEVARALTGPFGDGVYFVDLAPLSDHALVAKAIAGALGVIEKPAEPQIHTLQRALAGREILLVIDNFEHVIEAAPLISELLAASPRLKALVTSREPLHISGEQEYPVPPLSLPASADPEALAESEAVSLFVQRAQMVLPHFDISAENAAAIAGICARLDGLPLALELAAARCKLLSPQAILGRLDNRLATLTSGPRDAPARHQTLRQTLDWSYNLLDEGEKRLFARLAVFRGGAALDAVEAVCSCDLPMSVVDGLGALADKSLIRQSEALNGEPRFVMLETIHEYANLRLAESGEQEALRRRHAEFFVDLAERAEPKLVLPEQDIWSQRLELELENLRSILNWSTHEGDAVLGVRLAGALYLFWWADGYHVEGSDWTRQLLKRLAEVPAEYHAKFLFSAGATAFLRSDLDASRRLFLRSLDVARALNDKFRMGWALSYMSIVMPDEPPEAIARAEQGLSLFQELDYKPGIAHALNCVGLISAQVGDVERARRAYRECVETSRYFGETRLTCLVYQNSAFLESRCGNFEGAWYAARQALQIARKMHSRLMTVMCLPVVAGPLEAASKPENGARLLGAAEALLESMGAEHQPVDKPDIDRIAADARLQLGGDVFEQAWREGRALTLEEATAIALKDDQ